MGQVTPSPLPGWFLHGTRLDVGIVLLAVAALHWLPLRGVTAPPTGEALAEFTSATATNAWAVFAGLVTALVFFYGLARRGGVGVAEDEFGDDLFRAWRNAILTCVAFAVLCTVLVRPLDWVGNVVAFGWVLVGLQTLRVVGLTLGYVELDRRAEHDARLRLARAEAASNLPNIRDVG